MQNNNDFLIGSVAIFISNDLSIKSGVIKKDLVFLVEDEYEDFLHIVTDDNKHYFICADNILEVFLNYIFL